MKRPLIVLVFSVLFIHSGNLNAFSKKWNCTDSGNPSRTFKLSCVEPEKDRCLQEVYFDKNSNYVGLDSDYSKLKDGQEYICVSISQGKDFSGKISNIADVHTSYVKLKIVNLSTKLTPEQSMARIRQAQALGFDTSLYRLEKDQIVAIPNFEKLFDFHMGTIDNPQDINITGPEFLINTGCDAANLSRQSNCKNFGFKGVKYVCKPI